MRPQLSALIVGISWVVGSASLGAQSLGELAKKAEENRRAAKKGTRVYTNADAGNVPAATVAPPAEKIPAEAAGGDTSQAGQKPAAGAAQDKDPEKDQAAWADKLKTLQAQLERDTQFAAAIQTRINILSADLVNNDLRSRPAIEQDRARAMAELARLQKAITDGKQAIADFEEEARRAGVPPGWLR